MAAPISMAIPPTAPIAIPITITVSSVPTTSITSATASTASGIAATAIVAARTSAVRSCCARAAGNYYVTRLSFNHTIATIAAAIARHCSTHAATVFVRTAVVVVSAIVVIASRRPAVIVPTPAAVQCWIRARCLGRRWA